MIWLAKPPANPCIGSSGDDPGKGSGHLAYRARDEEEAEAGLEGGFQVFKLEVGNPDSSSDLASAKAVRKVPGDKDLSWHANQGGSRAQAVPRMKEMAACQLTFFEQPTKRWDTEGMARIAAGDAYRYARAGATEGVNVKLLKAGGISGALLKKNHSKTSGGSEIKGPWVHPTWVPGYDLEARSAKSGHLGDDSNQGKMIIR